MAQNSKRDLHLPVIALILAAYVAATVAIDPEEPEWNLASGRGNAPEYRSKRSADGANAVDEATTAKRGERNLYRLLRTLKKRGGPGDYRLLRTLKKRSSPGSFGNIFRHWALVHKRRPSTFGRFGRSDSDTMVTPNNVVPSWPRISLPPPRESRARDVPVHSNVIPSHQTPMPEEEGSRPRVHHFLRSLLRDHELGDLLDYVY